ncbi:hypothetical protein [Sphingomonas sp.]|uniref:hypothetical protein n=1 Tax=Sphingomonas sp. TaxID=28214 RepID=UPI003D6C8B98
MADIPHRASYRSRPGSVARAVQLPILVSVFLMGCTAHTADKLPYPAKIVTNGDIRMDADRNLFVYYDNEPGKTYGAAPGEQNYQSYLEMAGDIRPGQKKRLRARSAVYKRNKDRSISVYDYISIENAVSEPGIINIEPKDKFYSCYDDILDNPSARTLYIWINGV